MYAQKYFSSSFVLQAIIIMFVTSHIFYDKMIFTGRSMIRGAASTTFLTKGKLFVKNEAQKNSLQCLNKTITRNLSDGFKNLPRQKRDTFDDLSNGGKQLSAGMSENLNNLQNSINERPEAVLNNANDTPPEKTLIERRNDFLKKIVIHESYDIVQYHFFEDFDIGYTLYKHRKSGANVLSFDTNHKEKTFIICVKTLCSDSSGLPHIIEHSVLSGSEKYPLKDLFLTLEKGSMLSYINAVTFNDMTCYPISSLNTKTFYNVADVIFDTVYNPLSMKSDKAFRTEGFHYEIVNNPSKIKQSLNQKDEDDEQLVINGVVYNEMKGYYSNPHTLLFRTMQEAIYPDSYPYDSGGIPSEIAKLTYKKYKDYYNKFYKPDNSIFAFWGNDNVNDRLNFLDERLKNFNKSKNANFGFTKPQTKFSEPKSITKRYHPTTKDPGHTVFMGWLYNPLEKPFKKVDNHSYKMNPLDYFGLLVLNYILIGNDQSLLSKALIKTRMGTSILMNSNFDSYKHYDFYIGLEGITNYENPVPHIELLILHTLEKAEINGIPTELVHAAINHIEMLYRTSLQEGKNAGINVIFVFSSMFFHGDDLNTFLSYKKYLNQIKKYAADGEPYFSYLIKRYLLNNTHRVTVHLIPDTNVESDDVKEKDYLRQLKSTMSSEQLNTIKEDAKQLKEYQMTPDPPEIVSKIPLLALNDIEKKQRHIEPDYINEVLGVKVLHTLLPSDDIAYINVAFDLRYLNEEVKFLSFFSNYVLSAGSILYPEGKLSTIIDTYTGGIQTSMTVDNVHLDESQDFYKIPQEEEAKGYLVFRASCLSSQTVVMMHILKEIICNTNFQNQSKAYEIIKDRINKIGSNLSTKGFRYALKRVKSSFTSSDFFYEAVDGITSYYYYQDLLENVEKNYPIVERLFSDIMKKIISKNGMIIALSGDKNAISSFYRYNSLKIFINAIPNNNFSYDIAPIWSLAPKVSNYFDRRLSEIYSLPILVNNVAMGGRLLEVGEKFSGSYTAISNFVSSNYVWEMIRSVGGAYGGNFHLYKNGIFVFFSLMDPKLQETLKSFRLTGKFMLNVIDKISDADITRSIIKTIMIIDRPTDLSSKSQEALFNYIFKLSYQNTQEYRNQILQTNREDFRRFAERLSAVLEDKSKLSISVIASKNSVQNIRDKQVYDALQNNGFDHLNKTDDNKVKDLIDENYSMRIIDI